MYPAQPGVKDPSYKVKNTFLEFSVPEEVSANKRRSRSDALVDLRQPMRHSPLVVAAKSPTGSPSLQPVDETMQAVPIEEVSFELLEEAADPDVDIPAAGATRSRYHSMDGSEPVAQSTAGLGRDEPAYVVPTTPSPFLHSSFPPAAVPPFSGYAYGVPDMGLPPAFGDGDAAIDAGYGLGGMPFIPPEMYDPTGFGQYMPGWGLPMDGMDGTGVVPGDSYAGYACEAMLQQAEEQQEQGVSGAFRNNETATSAPQEQLAESTSSTKAAATAAAAPGEQPDRPSAQAEGGGGGRRGKSRREASEEEGAERRATTNAAAAGDAENAGTSGGADAAKNTEATSGDSSFEAKDGNTTVMLRNIPNKYTREMLIKQLTVDFQGQFDFMYLPIDFKNKCNVGYGFINFRTVAACDRFVAQFHGVDVRKCLPGLNSKKVVEVTPARVQGKDENVRRLRNSPVMNQLQDHPEWMPLIFNDQGEEEPFPKNDQPLPPVKPRGRNREGREQLGDS